MSTADYQPVPILFDEWIAQQGHRRVDRQKCEGCYRADLDCWEYEAPNGMVYCEACMRRTHGADSEEQNMTLAIIGGAVHSALDAGASPELVRAAALGAIDGYEQRQQEELKEILRRYPDA